MIFSLGGTGWGTRTIRYKNVRSPVANRREMSRLVYESLTCRLRLGFFGAFVNCHPRPLLGTHDQANRNEPGLAGNGLAGQIACCTNGGLVCHCTAMTSPCLVSSARAGRATRHYSFDSHQMATWTAQWGHRRPTSRREPHQFPDRRHRATVCALSACDINKSGGLAEKSSAHCEVIARAVSTKQTEDYYASRADATSEC
jgi:hypothetical protein